MVTFQYWLVRLTTGPHGPFPSLHTHFLFINTGHSHSPGHSTACVLLQGSDALSVSTLNMITENNHIPNLASPHQ